MKKKCPGKIKKAQKERCFPTQLSFEEAEVILTSVIDGRLTS